MFKYLRLLFLFSLAIIIFISCNQEPSSVGSDLISDKDKIGFKQIDTYELNSFQKSSYLSELNYTGTAKYVLLGKLPYMEVASLYHWSIYLPDSILTSFKNNDLQITAAWIQMRPRYTIGDKNANFDFSVHQIRTPWSTVSFNKDSISKVQYDAADIKTSLSYDSVYKFNINTDVVKEWLKYKADTTTTPKNHGLILRPKATSNKIQGFYSSETYLDTSETLLKFAYKKLSTGFADTILVSPDLDIHAVTNSTSPSAGTNIYVEGTYPYRAKLYFDLSSLPKNIIPSYAQLELTIDSTKWFNGPSYSDSIYVQTLADSGSTKLSKDSLYYSVLKRTGYKFSGDISWMVLKWLRDDLYYPNNGLIISLTDEINSAARIAICGSNDSNKLKRPRLKITYMQKQ